MAHLHSRYPLAINHVIRALVAQFGVLAKVYQPISFNNGQHGRLDEDNSYDYSNPFFSGKLLIPSIYDLKIGNDLPLSDLLYAADDSNTLLVETGTTFPLGSKIILDSVSNDTNTYLIDDEYILGDDEYILFKKYKIVPFDSLTLPHLHDNVAESLVSVSLDDDLLSGNANIASHTYNPLVPKD